LHPEAQQFLLHAAADPEVSVIIVKRAYREQELAEHLEQASRIGAHLGLDAAEYAATI
jgi:hypothetical protein